MIRREVFHNDNFVKDHSTMNEADQSILGSARQFRTNLNL